MSEPSDEIKTQLDTVLDVAEEQFPDHIIFILVGKQEGEKKVMQATSNAPTDLIALDMIGTFLNANNKTN